MKHFHQYGVKSSSSHNYNIKISLGKLHIFVQKTVHSRREYACVSTIYKIHLRMLLENGARIRKEPHTWKQPTVMAPPNMKRLYTAYTLLVKMHIYYALDKIHVCFLSIN